MVITCECANTVDEGYVTKSPFLDVLRKPEIITINFGKVAVGDTCTKICKIKASHDPQANEKKNMRFVIKRNPHRNPIYKMYDIEPFDGFVAPDEIIELKLTYAPAIPFQADFDKFSFEDPTKQVTIVVKGECIGPRVTTSIKQMNFFKSTQVRDTKQHLELMNVSDVAAEFIIDKNISRDIFVVNPMRGIVPPNKQIYITIVFKSSTEGYFSQNLRCIILHQGPLIVDLVGVYEKNIIDTSSISLERFFIPYNERNGYESYLRENPTITMTKHYVDFGRCTKHTQADNVYYQATAVLNLTEGSMEIIWIGGDEIFNIAPRKAVLEPGIIVPFEVTFSPKDPNNFYERSFLAQIYWPKYDLNNMSLNVPLSLCLYVIGHSFREKEYVIPCINLPTSEIFFPPSLPISKSYANFKIENLCHFPMIFKFIPPKQSLITIKPMIGLIRDFAIISAKLTTIRKIPKRIVEIWRIEVNGNEERKYEVVFKATSAFPEVKLGEDNIIKLGHFQHGTTSTIQCPLINVSLFKVGYTIEVSDPQYLKIEPEKGIVEGYEEQNVTMHLNATMFGPKTITGYCLSRVIQKCDEFVGTERVNTFTVAYSCSYSILCAAPDFHEFDVVKWGTPLETTFHLFNFGETEVCFSMNSRLSRDSEGLVPDTFHFEPENGVLAPQQKVSICVKGIARSIGVQNIEICYYDRSGKDETENINERTHIVFRFSYMCKFFIIQIEELIQHNFGYMFTKSSLWELFNINEINTAFFNIIQQETKCVHLLVPEFVQSPKEYYIKFVVKNTTVFTNEVQMKRKQLCGCALEETALSFNKTKKTFNCPHRNLIRMEFSENTFFGESCRILTIYIKYNMPGTNMLGFVLDLGDQRNVELIIHQTTIPRNSEKLSHFIKDLQVVLPEVFIGLWHAPLTTIWFYNNTDITSTFEVDTTEISALCQRNGFKIMEVLNPISEVAANSAVPLLIRFHPIESKCYEVSLPITLPNENITVRLSGTGRPTMIQHQFHCQDNSTSSLFLIGSDVELSSEYIIFDHICEWSTSEQIIFIRNTSLDKTFQFDFLEIGIDFIAEITVEPKYGIIEPKSSFSVLIKIKTYNEPIITDIILSCMVVDYIELNLYKLSYMRHFEEEERLKDEFTITEGKITTPTNKIKILPKPEAFYITLDMHLNVIHSKDAGTLWTPEKQLSLVPEEQIPIDVSKLVKDSENNPRRSSTRRSLDGYSVPDDYWFDTARLILRSLISDIVFSNKFEYLIQYSTQLNPPYYDQITVKPKTIQERKSEKNESIDEIIKSIREQDIGELFTRPSFIILSETLKDLILEAVHENFQIERPCKKTKDELDVELKNALDICLPHSCLCNNPNICSQKIGI